MTLTQALVTRYAKLSALANLIENWLKQKRGEILETLETEVCPAKGPFLLERKEVAAGPNWKDEFALYLDAEGKSAEQILGIFDRIHNKEREKNLRLEKKINPNYRRKFEIKLPA